MVAVSLSFLGLSAFREGDYGLITVKYFGDLLILRKDSFSLPGPSGYTLYCEGGDNVWISKWIRSVMYATRVNLGRGSFSSADAVATQSPRPLS
jgi:hypothetical protein